MSQTFACCHHCAADPGFHESAPADPHEDSCTVCEREVIESEVAERIARAILEAVGEPRSWILDFDDGIRRAARIAGSFATTPPVAAPRTDAESAR